MIDPPTPNVKTRLLIVDDDRIILDSLAELLRLDGYEVDTACSLKDAVQAIDRSPYELIISDVNMPAGDGFELLHVIKKRIPETAVIMITAYGTIESAVEAIKMGAHDYLTKPVNDDELKLCIERACAQQRLISENRELRARLGMRYGLNNVVGHDYRMLKIFDLVEAVADSKATVLLQGPSGTGKSLIAGVVHQRSPRRDKSFIDVSCGGLPDTLLESELFGHARGAFTGAVANKQGKFKVADGGTIFLDEISVASPALQVKLLRVLQSQQFEPVGSNKTESVDVRVIVATNVDLETEVKEGRFREDLFYRVNVVSIDLPPLCERVTDIPLLCEYFLEQQNAESKRTLLGLDDSAMGILQQYHWPGNVRELANVVERACLLAKGPYISETDLPAKLIDSVQSPPADRYTPTSLREALAQPEQRIIEAALRANGWNRQATAEQLDINRTTLYKKMKRYGLDADPKQAVAVDSR